MNNPPPRENNQLPTTSWAKVVENARPPADRTDATPPSPLNAPQYADVGFGTESPFTFGLES